MSVLLQVVMEVKGGEPREFEYEFEQPRITLGREENNDIQIPLASVSRNHCVIFYSDGEWYLEDLHSTHGTVHNGKQVGSGGKKLLRNGDVVELVHFRITFTAGGVELLSSDYSVEKTEALAQKMVKEVLASIGRDADVPYLRVMNGPDEGQTFPLGLDATEVVVGRGNDCDFQINDANISRRHAIIRRDWSDITIEDLGSKNGVVINERRIQKTASLRDADQILLGAVQLTFIDPSAKFIGKLDDIAVFANEAARSEIEAESMSEEEPEPEPEPEPDPVPEPEPEADPEPRVAAEEDPPRRGGAGGEGEAEDEGAGELDALPSDDELAALAAAVPGRGFGPAEYGLMGLAAVVVVGLVGLLLYLLFG